MYSKVNYTIVGLFVVVFSIGLFWFSFWLAKYGLQEEYSTYRLEMKDSISGLSKDSSVKLHGVNIGRVSSIRINPKNIEVIEILLEIKEGIPIKEDMIASTQMLGITGLLSIEIDGGSNEAKTLMPTETYIPLIMSKPSLLSKLTNNIAGLGDTLDNLLVQSQKLLSHEHVETVGKILNNTQRLTQKALRLEDKALVSLEEVDKTLKEFRVSMDNINAKFTDATRDFKQMQKDFSEIKGVTVPMVDKVFQTSQSFKRVILKFEKSLDRGDYNLKKMLEPLLVDIQILSAQLNTMTRELGQNPSKLLFKSRELRRGPGE